MMSHTYDQRKQENDQIWKIEIFSRIIRFEKQFPELWGTAHKPHKVPPRTSSTSTATAAHEHRA